MKRLLRYSKPTMEEEEEEEEEERKVSSMFQYSAVMSSKFLFEWFHGFLASSSSSSSFNPLPPPPFHPLPPPQLRLFFSFVCVCLNVPPLIFNQNLTFFYCNSMPISFSLSLNLLLPVCLYFSFCRPFFLSSFLPSTFIWLEQQQQKQQKQQRKKNVSTMIVKQREREERTKKKRRKWF